jgi:hypothetical protein
VCLISLSLFSHMERHTIQTSNKPNNTLQEMEELIVFQPRRHRKIRLEVEEDSDDDSDDEYTKDYIQVSRCT